MTDRVGADAGTKAVWPECGAHEALAALAGPEATAALPKGYAYAQEGGGNEDEERARERREDDEDEDPAGPRRRRRRRRQERRLRLSVDGKDIWPGIRDGVKVPGREDGELLLSVATGYGRNASVWAREGVLIRGQWKLITQDVNWDFDYRWDP